jgi:hypothetical protein
MRQENIENRRLHFMLLILLICITVISSCSGRVSADILVAGGSTSGVAAGVQAARMGARTVIIEENEWLGGMLTSAGVSATDGNYNLPGGIWGEFRNALSKHYGGDSLLRTGWVSNIMFEPSAGKMIFSEMAAAEPYLKVVHNAFITKLKRRGEMWEATVKTGERRMKYSAKILIDATELGDIAAMCGADYDLGMDSRYDTGEEIAPEKSNDIVQDLTYVAILKDYGTAVHMERPEGYDSSLFACACINPLCAGTGSANALWSCDKMMTYGKLPGNKYMINWPVSGNDFYVNLVEMDMKARETALKQAKHKTLCFVYFISHELGYTNLALADDEFPTPDRLPFIPYYRESRRIRGKVRFTLNHITSPYDNDGKLYRTAIAVGDYPVDHHHSAYSGPEDLPDLSFRPVPSFGLPLGTLIPGNVEGLIVAEKSISVTNLVNGATRLQPVVLQIGQAAGALGALAVLKGVRVSEVPVRDVQNILLDAGGYLLPYLDVTSNHPWFKSLQRIGATGIMKGAGKSQGWSNQTWFRAFDLTLLSELGGMREFWQPQDIESFDDTLSVGEIVDIIRMAGEPDSTAVNEQALARALGVIFNGNPADMDRPALRGEAALLIDMALDPFNRFGVEIDGSLDKKNLSQNR